MPFPNLEIKRSYDSYSDDIVGDFFNPVLKETKIYKRAAAYFSSSSLKAISKGLSGLLLNNGKMQLIVAIILSEDDFEAIAKGIENIDEQIASIFADEKVILEMLENNSAKALYNLIASDKLTIKFIISPNGIFHMKFGIMEDSDGNLMSFSGSINETFEGYEVNGEEFKVFRNWIQGEDAYVKDDIDKFSSYWRGERIGERVIVSDLPVHVATKIKETVKKASSLKKMDKPTLRRYQEEATEFWVNSGNVGILEMATGTGKTLTALTCAKELYASLGKKFTIILVPTLNLALQWKESWENFFDFSPYVYDPRHKQDFYSYCSFSGSNGAVILTYTSMSKNAVPEHVLEENTDGVLIIADEAHWLGAHELSRIMHNRYTYKLGLSATPQRLLDEEGTGKILEFFGYNEFIYGLHRAISEHYLSEYNYYPYFCELTPSEIREYEKLTQNAIAPYIGGTGDGITAQEIARLQRARVSKKASGKIAIFSEIISNLSKSGKLHHTLVFFEDHEQLWEAKEELTKLSIPFEVVDAEKDAIARKKAAGRLESGQVACILSMKALDEGTDMPAAQREIIMSSSTNSRQYIQRAGRILRLHPRKEIAEIYDIVVYAKKENCPEWLWKYEVGSIKNELKRAMYFTDASRNKAESIMALHDFGRKVNISIWE